MGLRGALRRRQHRRSGGSGRRCLHRDQHSNWPTAMDRWRAHSRLVGRCDLGRRQQGGSGGGRRGVLRLEPGWPMDHPQRPPNNSLRRRLELQWPARRTAARSWSLKDGRPHPNVHGWRGMAKANHGWQARLVLGRLLDRWDPAGGCGKRRQDPIFGQWRRELDTAAAPGTNTWWSVACSADCTKMVAVADDGEIWTSIAGTTPAPRVPSAVARRTPSTSNTSVMTSGAS